jgi:hypothetical protein
MLNECGYIVFLLLLVPYIESGKYKTFDNIGVQAIYWFTLPFFSSDDVNFDIHTQLD